MGAGIGLGFAICCQAPKLLASVTAVWCLHKHTDPAGVEAETELAGALHVIRKLQDYLVTGAIAGVFCSWERGATVRAGEPLWTQRYDQLILAVVL